MTSHEMPAGRYLPERPGSGNGELMGFESTTPSPASTTSLSLSLHQFGTELLCQSTDKLIKALLPFKDVVAPQKQVLKLFFQAQELDRVSHELQRLANEHRFAGRSTSSIELPTVDAFQSQTGQLWYSISLVGEQCSLGTIDSLLIRIDKIDHPYVETSRLQLPIVDLMWYDQTFRALKVQTDTLHVLEMAIALVDLMNNVNDKGELPHPNQMRDMTSTLQSCIASLKPKLQDPEWRFDAGRHGMGVKNMQRAVEEAESVLQYLPAISINVHYRIPRRSKDIYTGRQLQMKAIEDAFSASIPPIQKRFVIQGQPGTGKTEMALKYAEEHVRQYWGVFWVDASSSANTMLSYAKIAEVGGVERNENAAKHWLSSCVSPWLLIVDNADDDEPLEELLPLGTQGRIIVTTRNRRHISYNIRGCSSLELGAMDDDDAKVLLLRAAHEPTPWTEGIAKVAMEVCKHLHFLPLALIQAGKAIVTNVCKLANYISHFEDEADRIHRERQRRRRQQSSPSFSRQVRADKESMNVFGSYEILHQSLIGAARKEERFRDALQLLHIFSYMHFQNIRLDILVQAAVAPLREATAVEAGQRQEAILLRKLGIVTPPQSWRAWLQDLARSIVARFATPVVLPEALKNLDNLDAEELEKDIRRRLREALGVLVSRSLVLETPIETDSKPESHQGVAADETERFYMHPVVHKWIRERPQDDDSAAHDALVCQYAKTILMRAIVLQGGDTPAEIEMRREMRPHIDHVRACDAGIHRQFQKNRQSRAPGVLSSLSRNEDQEPVFGPLRAQEYARYARVYLECGLFSEANALLERVESYLVERVGNHHALTHRVRIARSETLYALTFWNDATKLLDQVYESQQSTLGQDHPETLRCASRLAASILTQGRITHALELCEATYNRMVKVYGPDHVESLKCVQQMARCHSYFLNAPKAVRLYEQALKGMTARLEARLASPAVGSDTDGAADPNGPSESDVLYLQTEFATELIKDTSPTGRLRYAEAEQLLTQTAAKRSALSGKEHPFSLLALASLGRALAANGRTAEATQLMGETLEVAERNHGSDNLAVLAGKAWYAAALALHGDLAAAERYFREASDKAMYAKASADDGEHPDRIGHAWLLVDVLVQRSKLAEALELCLDLRETLPKVGGHGLGSKHPLNVLLGKKITEIEQIMRDGAMTASRTTILMEE
ncbi:hypothetical protein F5Y14DRAFT_436850 [Nemania sp. NC0429]|nr:hypothetical protein F5Y14DRAFT_436850 [Nemania sp. NC0429]